MTKCFHCGGDMPPRHPAPKVNPDSLAAKVWGLDVSPETVGDAVAAMVLASMQKDKKG